MIKNIFCLFLGVVLYAQEQPNSFKSSIFVHGSSSVHNWGLEVDIQEVQLNKITIRDDRLESIAMDFSVNALVATKKEMHNKIRKALKFNKFPVISIQFKALVFKNDSLFTDAALFTIAGVSKKLSFKSSYVQLKNKEILLSGKQQIRMSDFNIKPPSAMFGLMSVGNELLVEFELYFSLKNKNSVKIK